MTDLVSRGTRGRFRDLATDCYVNNIAAAFQDEGIAPNHESAYDDSSIRRTTAQKYMESVDWSNEEHVMRALRAMERLIEDFNANSTARFWHALDEDGFKRDPDTGRLDLRPTRTRLTDPGALANLTNPTVIHAHLRRLQSSVDTDPELAIGSSKELIESTAKLVLMERQVEFTKDDDLPQLTNRAQEALKLHPKQGGAGAPDGDTSVKRILGGVLGVAVGVAELRNTHGTGHGRETLPTGLGPRHARLAANAAYLWCELMLDTLADPAAPWRKQETASQA